MQWVWPLSLMTLFIGTVIIALLAFKGGLRLGRWRSRRPDPEPLLPVRSLVASILSLLAFILGFTFGLATSHFDSRSESAFEEAIAIGTAYRRADFLQDPERTALRRLLLDYIDMRLGVQRSGKDVDETIARVRQLQNQIWRLAIGAGKKNNGHLSPSPLMQSISEVVDIQGERVLAGMRSRIPVRVWLVLYGIMSISVGAAGYHAGLAGARRSIAAVGYALVFSAVIVMIAAGDVPGSEQFRKSEQVLSDLRVRLTHFEESQAILEVDHESANTTNR
jgi:hypothetical protein